jgi:hypothetical protein
MSGRAATATFVVVVAAFCFHPLLGAGFFSDDWHFFALFRHGDSILDAFTTNYVGTYVYRPIGLLLSWFSFRIFELNAAPHYALNVALHAWAAFALYALLRQIKCESPVAAFAAAAFALMPTVTPTVAWIANRFELVATAASLSAIGALAVSPSSMRCVALSLLFAVVAIGAKETGFAVLPACCVLIAFDHSSLHARAKRVALFCLLGAFALFVRVHALGEFQPEALAIRSISGTIDAIVLQLATLIRTIAVDPLFLFALIALTLLALVFGTRRKKPVSVFTPNSTDGVSSATMATSLLTLFVVTLVVQAPIAAWMFSSGHTSGANLRFFYMPFAATLGLVAICVSLFVHTKPRGVTRAVAVMFACSALALQAYSSHRYLLDWQRMSLRANEEVVAARGALLRAASSPARDAGGVCFATFARDASVETQEPFLDAAAKTAFARGNAATNCVLLTDPPQAFSLTRIEPCVAASFRPLSSAEPDTKPLQRSGTCTLVKPQFR